MSYSQYRRKSASGLVTEGIQVMRGSRTSADHLPIQHLSPFASRRLQPVRQQMKEAQKGKPSLFEATVAACAEYRRRFIDAEILQLKNPSQVEMIDARDFLGVGEYCLVNQITPLDIREGAVLKLQSIAIALSLLSEQPGLILRVFSEQEPNEYGVNSVWLYHQAAWQEILVDERVPVVGDETAIEFAYCRTSQDELWIILVEKALAKLHGGYNNLEFMDVNQVLIEITGASFLNFGLQSSLSLKETHLSWEELKGYCSEGHLVYAVCNPLDRTMIPSGFLPGMCYSIIGTALAETSQGQKDFLVKVRVVWGESGWQQGNWSPNDPAWELKRNRLVAEYDSAADGVYCLSFADFNAVFEKVTVFFISDTVTSSCLTLNRTAECQRDSSILDVAQEAEYIITLEQSFSSSSLGGLVSADAACFWPAKCFLVSVVGKHSAIVETALSIGQRYTVMRARLLPGRFMLISDIYGKHQGISDQKLYISLKSLHPARLQPICPIQLSYAQTSDALYQAFKNLVSQYSGLFGNLKILRPVQEFGASGSPEVIISSSFAADDQIGIQVHKFSLSGPLEANSIYCMNLAVQITAGELLCPNPSDIGCSIMVTNNAPTGYLIFNIDPRANLGHSFQFKLELTSITEVPPATSGSLDHARTVYALGVNTPSEMSNPSSNFDVKQFLSRVKPPSTSKPQQARGQATRLLGKHTRELQAIAEGQEASKQNPCGDCNLL